MKGRGMVTLFTTLARHAMRNHNAHIDVQEALVRAGLLTAPGQSFKTQRLSGGLTNDNVLVTLHATQPGAASPTRLVLRRFCNETSRHLHYDRVQEHLNSLAAAQCGIGPKVLAFFPATSSHGGGLLIEYIEGTTLDEEAIQQLCKCKPDSIVKPLSQLHTAPPFRQRFDPIQRRAVYVEECRKLCSTEPSWPDFDNVAAGLAAVEGALARINEKHVPCHNDLLAANFISCTAGHDLAANDGELKLIDYELSGMAPASWELGNIISENGMDNDATAMRNLVERYWHLRLAHEKPDCAAVADQAWIDGRIARVEAWSLVSKVTWAAWGRILFLLSREKEAMRGGGVVDEDDAESAFDYTTWSMTKLDRARDALSDANYISCLVARLRRDETEYV